MGSDHAPHVEIDGALAATRDFGAQVILVGQAEKVEPELRRCGWRGDGDRGIEFVEAAEVIAMDDPVATSVRRKKKSSLRIGTKLVIEGRGDGFVSAGNTGAAMATAKMVIGTIPGVDRPALAAMIPTKAGKPTLLIDVGANSECKPHHLVQFAIMGDAYSRSVLGTDKPSVGLMSIGEEEAKGNDLTKEAFPLLRELDINFVGNVVLKFGEGLALGIFALLHEELRRTIRVKIGTALALPGLRAVRRRMDYTEYGGAPLLGVNGVCIIGHGSSKAKTVRGAVALAADTVRAGLVAAIREDVGHLALPAASAEGDNAD